MTDRLQWLMRELLSELTGIRFGQPGPMYIISKREIEMDKWEVRLALPPKSASDVVSRKLRLDTPSVVYERLLDADAALTEYFVFDENDTVNASLVDTDNAGNDSPPSVLSFVVVDDVAPPEPGLLAVNDKREVVDPSGPAGEVV